MTETELEDILMTLPSLHQRASVLAHFFRMREQLRRLTEEVIGLRAVAATVSSEPDVSEIVAWIRATNSADTVRAIYARKLADRIEAGEYRENAPKSEGAVDVLA